MCDVILRGNCQVSRGKFSLISLNATEEDRASKTSLPRAQKQATGQTSQSSLLATAAPGAAGWDTLKGEAQQRGPTSQA